MAIKAAIAATTARTGPVSAMNPPLTVTSLETNVCISPAFDIHFENSPILPEILLTANSAGPMAAATIPIFTIKSCMPGDSALNQSPTFEIVDASDSKTGATTFKTDSPRSAPAILMLFHAVLILSPPSSISLYVESSVPSEFWMISINSS